MNKLIILLVLFACSKNDNNTNISTNKDSIGIVSDSAVVARTDALPSYDPISDSTRVVEDGKIIKSIREDMLPITLIDVFTDAQQQYIIKIKEFNGRAISGKITPEDPEMNIRFNQIRLPSGEFDGPFSREISYDVPQEGELWLIIGKNNMASGKATGKFTVTVK